jgi:hypothetical protein
MQRIGKPVRLGLIDTSDIGLNGRGIRKRVNASGIEVSGYWDCGGYHQRKT